MKNLFNLSAVLFFFLVSVNVFGTTLGTFKIPLMIESESSGKFIDMTNEISKKSGVKFDIKLFPPKQTKEQFLGKQVDCIFPAIEGTYDDSINQSTPFYVKKVFLFMKGAVKKVTVDQLIGKKIGLTRGYHYSKELLNRKDIDFVYASSDESNIKMLLAGRIDFFIVEEKSGLAAATQFGNGEINYDKSDPISQLNVFYACHDKVTTDKISKAISDVIADGSLKAIFTK